MELETCILLAGMKRIVIISEKKYVRVRMIKRDEPKIRRQ